MSRQAVTWAARLLLFTIWVVTCSMWVEVFIGSMVMLAGALFTVVVILAFGFRDEP